MDDKTIIEELCSLLREQNDKSEEEILSRVVSFVESRDVDAEGILGLKASAILYREACDYFPNAEDFNLRLYNLLKIKEAKTGVLSSCLAVMLMNKDKFLGCDYLMWSLFCSVFYYLSIGQLDSTNITMSVGDDGVLVDTRVRSSDSYKSLDRGYGFLYNSIKTIYQKGRDDLLSCLYFDWDVGCRLVFSSVTIDDLNFKKYLEGLSDEK